MVGPAAYEEVVTLETSVEIVRVEPWFTVGEQEALAGFLSGYRG